MNPAATMESVVTLALLRLHGRDTTIFLQGQLSNDVNAMAVGATQLAGYHNPQGRVIALLRLQRLSGDEFLAQLPQELAAAVAQRLRRYVLRAQVKIDVLEASAAAAALPEGWSATRSRLTDIEAGLPQVYAATSEQFVAQMLNLDCIGAVSFTKGCYTGQEVIARAHYRGRVKRRMQRFVTTPAAPGAESATAVAAGAPALSPGASARLRDGRRLDIVDAALRADGHIEFLAVAPLPGSAPEPAADAATGAGLLLDCAPLPLPYPLPD